MDKYEFNIKVEQIKKMSAKGDYETAMKIADTIDWRRVRNVNILSMAASVYEKNEEYQEAKDILLLAFERAPIGKRLLYKLAELAVKEGSTAEAEDYYREFCDLAPDDPRQYILRYLILGAKGAPVEQLIHTLEQYCNVELDEKWLYELAELYNEAGMGDLCVMTCDKIMLMFGLGKYVDKAMELKLQYAPLTAYQADLMENRDKYEAKLKAVEKEYREGRPSLEPEPEPEAAFTREPEAHAAMHQSEPVPAVPDPEGTISPEEEVLAPEEGKAFGLPPVEEEQEPSAREPEYEPAPSAPARPLTGDELKARIHEAEAQEHLAREMSKLSEDIPASQEPEEAQTRILSDIRTLKRETSPGEASHLMIETENPEDGLNRAISELKKIHQKTGAKNQAAKITGEKLNRRGIFTLSDKLTGKDLIIEQAGDMNESILQELNQLMTRDETGINIVLIDTPDRLKELYRVYPGLARSFARISASDVNAVHSAPEPEKQPAPKQPLTEPVRPVHSDPAPTSSRPAPASPRPASASPRPVRRVEPKRDIPPMSIAVQKKPQPNPEPQEAPLPPEEEMDIDEFAQYACQYAGDIDCSISGKSMLALYERIEIMEEDGIPLTKANAEELIEEAADKAENPALVKKLTGIFSSKYDKDGLLILKEEHFL